jgi:F1F0 ATPase subunit 2
MTNSLLAAGLTTTAASMLAAGFILGLVYFAVLRWTVSLYAAGRSRVGPAVLTLARLAGAAGVLAFAARLGALPLLATFLGFLLARALSMHVVRRAE